MDILKQTSSTRENLGMLAVMDALEGAEEVTQRELAHMTGLNLKKVNYCLRKLLEKGHVKFQRARRNPDKRMYLYILTPAGLKEKSRLTYDFLKFTAGFYSLMENKLRQSLSEMEASGINQIVLYGTGEVARILLEMLSRSCVNVVGIVDDQFHGDEFQGLPVIKSSCLDQFKWDCVLITQTDNLDAVELSLHNANISPEAIRRLS